MNIQELIEKTKELIAIPSTRDNPVALREATQCVADMISARCPGVTIEYFEQNDKPSFLAYRGTVRPEKFDILLNGHVDVVPAVPVMFNPVIKNGRLYGRGALDMKGTTVVLTDVFCELVNEVPYRLGLQIVADEEIGGYNGVRLQIDKGVRAEFVVMGEYANDRHTIYNAARGLCWAEIAFKGKAAHGGHLWHGKNAIVKAGDFASAILKRYPTPNKETWTTTASIANLSTPNNTYNKVPDQAVLKVDFRFTQEDSTFENEESIRTFIATIDPDAELIDMAVFEPAVRVEEHNPYVQGLSAAMRQTAKVPAHFLGRPAGSDGRHYALVNNDVVEFGLYGQGSHSDEEYVELDSFVEYQDIMRKFLRTPQVASKQQKAEPLRYKLLRELVAMPTISADHNANNNALGYIENFLTSRGMHVKRYEYSGFRSIVATTIADNKRPAAMLSGHIDVVPGTPEQFVLTAKGDRLYGRGVLDMKFAIASYMWLVDELQYELEQYDFGIMITSDEEIGGQHGTKLLLEKEKYRSKVAIVPDGGDNWRLEYFAKGVQWIKLEAIGKSAHASRPWQGDSAIHHLLAALGEIQALIPPDRAPEDTLLSVGTIEGGTTPNQVSASASAVLDVRPGSMHDYEQTYPNIRAICKRHGVTTTLLVGAPPCVNDPNNRYIKRFSEIAMDVTGRSAGTSFGHGVTDGRYFSACDIPCIITVPPGDGHHNDVEWISRQGYEQFCAILQQYTQEFALPAPKQLTKKPSISKI